MAYKMLIAALVVLFVGLSVNAGIGVYSYVKINKHNENLVAQFNDFFTKDAQTNMSNFDKLANQTADLFADRCRVALTMADRGAQGAAARDINRGLEEVAVAGDPSLGLAQALPKSLKKNPLALAGLNMIINNIMTKQGAGAPTRANGSPPSQVKFDL